MPSKSFRFKLQTVLDLKERKEEEEKEKLARLFRVKAEEEALLAKLEMEKESVREELKRKQASGGLDIEKIKMFHGHLKTLDNRITHQRLRLKEIDIAIDRQRDELLKATQEKKTLEKLREKHREVWLMEAEAEERKFIDELATIRSHRIMEEGKEGGNVHGDV
jgi:flagellar FliJ protein